MGDSVLYGRLSSRHLAGETRRMCVCWGRRGGGGGGGFGGGGGGLRNYSQSRRLIRVCETLNTFNHINKYGVTFDLPITKTLNLHSAELPYMSVALATTVV